MVPPDRDPLWHEHRSFVQKLAHALLADYHAAEDVVQTTWLAAMRRPPRSEQAVRPWLSRVVRNLAIKHRRAEFNRAHREAAAQGPDDGPPAGERLETDDLRRDVANAVGELDDSLQRVVALHYFDGLPVRDVAERVGLPHETVRSQLKRARARLRNRLEGSWGQGASWTACLVALDPSWKTTQVATTSFSWGALAQIAAVLLATITAGWFGLLAMAEPSDTAREPFVALRPDDTQGEPTGARAAPFAPSSPSDVARFDALDAGSPLELASTSTSASPELGPRLIGRVLGRNGVPLPGARVYFGDPLTESVFRTPSDFRRGWERLTWRGRLTEGAGWSSVLTDDEGQYAIPLEGTSVFPTIAAVHPEHGLTARVRPVRQVELSVDSIRCDLRLQGLTQVRGLVLNGRGEPVSDASVKVDRVVPLADGRFRGPEIEIETQPNGSFRTPALRSGPYFLVVRSPRHRTLELGPLEADDEDVLDLGTLTLGGRAVLQGRLRLDGNRFDRLLERLTECAGCALSGPLRVVNEVEGTRLEAGRILNGRESYEFDSLPRAGAIVLRLGDWELARALVDGSDLPDLDVDPRRLDELELVDVTVRATDAATGEPLAHVRAWIAPYETGEDGLPARTTPWQPVEEGLSAMRVLPGRYLLDLRPRGFARRTLAITVGSQDSAAFEFPFSAANSTVLVRLIGPRGLPVGRANVHLFSESGTPRRPAGPGMNKTTPKTASGHFRFLQVAPGRYRLSVRPLRPFGDPDSFAPFKTTIDVGYEAVVRHEVKLPEGRPVQFRIEPEVGVEGPYALSVWDADGVRVRDDASAQQSWCGELVPAQLTDGSYSARIASTNGTSEVFAFTVPVGGPVRVPVFEAAFRGPSAEAAVPE